VTQTNSQFTIRQATLGNPSGAILLGRDPNTNPPDTTTDTDTTTTDTDTTVADDTTVVTTQTDTVVEDKPSTTATTATTTDDKPKTACSGYCKTANILSLGMYGAVILFLLAMSYQAVKVGGKVNTPV
jgi:hypothetical protein